MAVILEFPKADRAKRDDPKQNGSGESAKVVLFTGVRYEREALFDDDVIFESTTPDKVRNVRE